MDIYCLCTDPKDPFLDERAYWIAQIVNGDTGEKFRVYQDDDRPGITFAHKDAHSTWVRLRCFLKDNPKYHIEFILLKFRDHIVNIPHEDAVGYYFGRGILGQVGGEDTHYVIFGTINNVNQKSVARTWYHLPALEIYERDTLPRKKWQEEQIIWNEN